MGIGVTRVSTGDRPEAQVFAESNRPKISSHNAADVSREKRLDVAGNCGRGGDHGSRFVTQGRNSFGRCGLMALTNAAYSLESSAPSLSKVAEIFRLNELTVISTLLPSLVALCGFSPIL